MDSFLELALRGKSPSLTNSKKLSISPHNPSELALRGTKPTVFVGMSGGVDSSASALLLKQQGYNVKGIYMKNWSKDLPGMKCPWAEDLADAKRVAVKLGIDFEVWDFEKEYYEKVVEYMISEFKAGNTPNPDVMCNQEIKFKLFYEKAMERGADFIATGHYARVSEFEPAFPSSGLKFSSTSYTGTRTEPSLRDEPVRSVRNIRVENSNQIYDSGKAGSNSPMLMMAVDQSKDQTYFLYRISDEALSRTIFPIGGMLKKDVKKFAQENGLHNAYKKESMGVCFVGEVGMRDFLKEYIDIAPGEIQEIETGKVVGHHEGAVFYTIGQRHGLYISGNVGEINTGLPYYVVKKDLKNNIVYVSRDLNNANIWTDELKLKDIIVRDYGGKPVSDVLVRLRHLGQLMPAKLDGDTLRFEQKIKRPASGQSAVFYQDEVCLGGGIII
ncbi:tRNA-specific 2-thiouridylase [Candidatus Saccharibacteria bacterium]|nr:tRNA-specific 2-thiouridylase [Candidatus Saccharibacteria bacterium]